MAPKTATLKVDGTVQALTEGKYEADVEFDKEVELMVEQEGYTPDTKKIKIGADNEKNKVVIDLKKAMVIFQKHFANSYINKSLKTHFLFQFNLVVNVTPKTATLKVDGTEVALTDGKYTGPQEFEKEVSLKVELEGYGPKEKTHKMTAKDADNIVNIDVSKKEVCQKTSWLELL